MCVKRNNSGSLDSGDRVCEARGEENEEEQREDASWWNVTTRR